MIKSTVHQLDLMDNLQYPMRIKIDDPKLVAAIDEGAIFQLWLRKIAEILFSPSAALFLPTLEGVDPDAVRPSPIPGTGCENVEIRELLTGIYGWRGLYRLAGRIIGLTLRPWTTPFGDRVQKEFVLATEYKRNLFWDLAHACQLLSAYH